MGEVRSVTQKEFLNEYREFINNGIKALATFGELEFSYLDFSNCLFKNISFSYLDLRKINFSGSIFDGCLFGNTIFSEVDFDYAIINGSTFGNIVAYNVHFPHVVFENCCFVESFFLGCNFDNVNFLGNNYSRSCNFSESVFIDVVGADILNVPMACPHSGSFVGYKKCLMKNLTPVIVKLEIPADAKRSSGTGKKCRCDKAKVLQIETLSGDVIDDCKCVFPPLYTDNGFKYTVGDLIYSDSFTENRFLECSHGIHFFLNRDDAVAY